MADPSLLSFQFLRFLIQHHLEVLMDNCEQGRDGQPLADQVILRPDVDPFLPLRASLIIGLSNLSNTVDGISSHLDRLSE